MNERDLLGYELTSLIHKLEWEGGLLTYDIAKSNWYLKVGSSTWDFSGTQLSACTLRRALDGILELRRELAAKRESEG
jgi:hypothetical protein